MFSRYFPYSITDHCSYIAATLSQQSNIAAMLPQYSCIVLYRSIEHCSFIAATLRQCCRNIAAIFVLYGSIEHCSFIAAIVSQQSNIAAM